MPTRDPGNAGPNQPSAPAERELMFIVFATIGVCSFMTGLWYVVARVAGW